MPRKTRRAPLRSLEALRTTAQRLREHMAERKRSREVRADRIAQVRAHVQEAVAMDRARLRTELVLAAREHPRSYWVQQLLQGLTMGEVGRRAGMPLSTVSRILNGHRKPYLDTALSLARVLHLTPEKLESGLLMVRLSAEPERTYDTFTLQH